MYPAVIRKSVYLQNNKTESQQNSTSVKQQNSVSTQQRNSKTVTSVSTDVNQSAFLNKTSPDLPFLIGFVPDVGFGNGWFASSDWPANKGERDVIFDPFLGVRNIICFAPGKLCFPLREIDFVTENSLPARGWKTPPKSSFFTGHPMCRDRILTAEGFPAPFVQKWGPWMEGIIASNGQKKRSRLSKAAPTNGDIMFRFSDENHTDFLTVIAKYDEHSMACSISNRGRDTTLSSYT